MQMAMVRSLGLAGLFASDRALCVMSEMFCCQSLLTVLTWVFRSIGSRLLWLANYSSKTTVTFVRHKSMEDVNQNVA